MIRSLSDWDAGALVPQNLYTGITPRNLHRYQKWPYSKEPPFPNHHFVILGIHVIFWGCNKGYFTQLILFAWVPCFLCTKKFTNTHFAHQIRSWPVKEYGRQAIWSATKWGYSPNLNSHWVLPKKLTDGSWEPPRNEKGNHLNQTLMTLGSSR